MPPAHRIEFSAFGSPPDVAACQAFAPNPPGPGEASVRMLYAPINPADLNFIQGSYGKVPALPAVPGNEGVGVIVETGPGVENLSPGDLVLPLPESGLWSQFVTLPAGDLIKLPAGLDPRQAAMLRINPATAWLLLTQFVQLQPGGWILQNAANSTVGISVIQIAASQGWQTVNFVRRPDAAEACRNAGATHVFVEGPDGKEAAKVLLAQQTPQLAINAVGGESALLLADLLAPRGHHVTIGAMSLQKLSLPNRFLIFKELTFTGFWVTRWMESAPPAVKEEIYSRLAGMMAEGGLKLPVEATYPLTEIKEALQHAQKPGRNGKVLVRINEQLAKRD